MPPVADVAPVGADQQNIVKDQFEQASAARTINLRSATLRARHGVERKNAICHVPPTRCSESSRGGECSLLVCHVKSQNLKQEDSAHGGDVIRSDLWNEAGVEDVRRVRHKSAGRIRRSDKDWCRE